MKPNYIAQGLFFVSKELKRYLENGFSLNGKQYEFNVLYKKNCMKCMADY